MTARRRPTRRDVLAVTGAAAIALPFVRKLAGAGPPSTAARRLIVFYFPDGVAGASQDGEPSLWHPTGSETGFVLPAVLAPLSPYRDRCVFFRGLSMGPTDSGSHPGGAKKLLTASDGGNAMSIDHRLASTVGAADPFRHLYLGAMANQNGASGDKHVSYVAPGVTIAPDDDPVAAFARVFAGAGDTPGDDHGRELSVLDRARTELAALRDRLGTVDRTKLDLHLEAVREVENRIASGASCTNATIDDAGITPDTLYAPERFPQILRAQTDLMVQAMACGLTRIGVIQSSHHTSELIMSRFPGTPMYDPSFDMRSHQASHYGPRHDPARREFRDFVAQRLWWVEQLAYLLGELAARPEDGATMLDHSLVLCCTEVCDGNTHLHDDMPFILAGGGSGTIRAGRLHDAGGRRHADLLIAIAHALGDPIASFGDSSSGPLPGLLA
jgi:hypothetical protein